MQRGLVIAILAGVLLASFPFIVDTIETYYSRPSTISTEPMVSATPGEQSNTASTTSPNITIVLPEVSSQGTDALIVRPGEVYVKPGTEFNVTITVLFKHAQPCPSPTWKVYYNISGGIEVLSDDGGKLVDSKTYVRVITVRAVDNGTIDVVFRYGETCPYTSKEKEEVQVIVHVVKSLENVSNNNTIVDTITPFEETTTTSTTLIENEYEYFNITGTIEYIDYTNRVIVVNNTSIEVRGSWVSSEGESLGNRYLLEILHVGEKVTVECYKTDEGVIRARRIIIDGIVYSKSGE